MKLKWYMIACGAWAFGIICLHDLCLLLLVHCRFLCITHSAPSKNETLDQCWVHAGPPSCWLTRRSTHFECDFSWVIVAETICKTRTLLSRSKNSPVGTYKEGRIYTRRWPNAGFMLEQHLLCCSNIEPALVQGTLVPGFELWTGRWPSTCLFACGRLFHKVDLTPSQQRKQPARCLLSPQ